MSDLIRREDVVEALYEAIRTDLKGTFTDSMSLAIAMANNLPSAELERTAKVKLQDICWEDIRCYKEGMCASCGRSVYNHAKYCDECGCRLEWDE